MKNIFLLFVICAACVPPSKENRTSADSVASDVYEDFSEVGPFTIKEEIRADRLTIAGTRNTAEEFLRQFYSPDTYRPVADSSNTPKYIITEVSTIEDTFFVAKDAPCERRSIVITLRGDFVEREYYDLLFITERDGRPVLADKLTFDGSEGQSSTIVSVRALDLNASKDCKLLEVTSFSEGGNVHLHKEEWVEFYIAERNSFRPVLRVLTENTDITAYEAGTGNDDQSSSSELREIVILESSSNGLFDIKVNYTSKQNGNLGVESTEVFAFNGETYALK